jgi:nicotinate-nucleotide adenylyltransferase
MAHTLLYGGTFDPIHHGHLIVCQRALELLGADGVMFIPARISPHKTNHPNPASENHRLAMLELAIAGHRAFRIDGRELTRPGPSYTIDTVESLRQEFPGEHFTLLLGTDQLPKLHMWRRAEDLLADNPSGPPTVAILPRPQDNTGRLELSDALAAIAGSLGRETADRLAKFVLSTPLVDVSATDIRRRVREGRSIRYLVPEAVAAYIERQGLYRSV